ncbi:MAG: hypothetical protein GY851_34470 [bacterium]|nr:hypothetical protein [bacterium]
MTLNYDTILGSLSGLLMVGYFPHVTSMVQERGTPTMKNIGWDDSLATQGSNFMKIEVGAADSGRPSAHILGDFGTPNKSRTAQLEYKYLPNSTDPQAQEFRVINTAARINAAEMDSVMNGNQTLDDLAARAMNQAVDSLNMAPSFMVHSDKNGGLGTVGVKKDFALGYGAAGTYTSGATSATLTLSGHSIGAFKRDLIIDIYNGDSMVADNLRIIRMDPINDAVMVEITTDSTVANLDSIAATHTIYRSGAKGVGFACAFNEIVKTDYSGDSSSPWMRLDRTLPANSIYVPEHIHRLGETTSKQVEITDLSALADSMEPYIDGDNNRPTYRDYMGTRMLQTLRDNTDDSQIRVVDGSTDNGTRKVGASKIVFTHPVLGDIELEGDPCAREDRMLLVPDGVVKFKAAGNKEMRVFPGENGVWGRVPGANANGAGTKEWKFEADKVMTMVCSRFDQIAASVKLTA